MRRIWLKTVGISLTTYTVLKRYWFVSKAECCITHIIEKERNKSGLCRCFLTIILESFKGMNSYSNCDDIHFMENNVH